MIFELKYKIPALIGCILLVAYVPASQTDENSKAILNEAILEIYNSPALALEKAEKAFVLASKKNDTISAAKALYLKGLYHVNAGNIQQGRKNFYQSKELIASFPANTLIVDLLLGIGESEYNQGEFEKALSRFLSAYKQAKALNYESGEAAALNFIGKYHYTIGNLGRSIHYYREAFIVASGNENTEQMIMIKNNIGKYYETLALYEHALKEYLSAYRLGESSQNLVNIATTYNHLGNIYEDLGDSENAYHYHFKALKLRKSIGYKEGIAKSEKNIGEIYEKLGFPDSALIYYSNSYERCRQINYKKGMIKSLYLSGNIYYQKGNPEMTKNNYEEALKLALEIGYLKGVLDIHLHFGKYYLEEGENDKAKEHLLKGIAIASENPLNELLEELYYEMYRMHYANGKLEQALAYYQKYAAQQKNMLDFEKQRNIEELKIAFESERQQQANKILRQENELKTLAIQRQNALIIIAGASILVLLLLMFMVWHRYRLKVKANRSLEVFNKRITKKNRELKRLNIKLDVANKEKDKFFSIIAHELRNPLWWFKNLAETLSNNFESMEKAKLKKAVNSLNESAKTAFHLMDNLLQWSRSQLDRIQITPQILDIEELIMQNKQLFLQEIEHKNIHIAIEIQPQLKAFADRQLIDTVLRNLISNAIKYTPDKGTITLSASEKKDCIEIIVSDTGIGIPDKIQKHLFDPSAAYTTLGLYQEKGSGLGLLLCKEFTEMNCGNIWLKSQENSGTSIGITLPHAKEATLLKTELQHIES